MSTRKLVKSLFVLSLFFMMCLSTNAKADSDSDKNTNANYLINEVKQKMKSSRSNSFDDVYAGAWIDDNNNPHLALVKSDESKFDIIKNPNEDGVIYNYFIHSYKELEEFQNEISSSELYEEKLILSSYINEPENEIKILHTRDIDANIKSIMSKINKNHIKVSYQKIEEDVSNTADYRGGAQVSNNSGSCSVGMVAKRNGISGIVTAGHCFSNNSNTNLGKVIARSWASSSNMDAEFIQTNVSVLPKQDITGLSYQKVDSLSFVTGSYLYSNSWKAKKSGKILSMNATSTFTNDGKYTNLIMTDYGTIGGMSGGVAIGNPGLGNAAIGIMKGGNSNNSYLMPASRIRNALGLTY